MNVESFLLRVSMWVTAVGVSLDQTEHVQSVVCLCLLGQCEHEFFFIKLFVCAV